MYFIFDTETNGLPGGNHYFSMISVGWVILDENLGKIDSGYHLLNRKDIPANHWDIGAMKVHGISRHKSTKEGENPESVIHELLEIMGSMPYTVAHNMRFDMKALTSTMNMFGFDSYPDNTNICTMEVSKRVFPRKSKSLKNTWSRMYPTKDFDKVFKHHNALDDAIACAHILHKFIKRGDLKLQNHA